MPTRFSELTAIIGTDVAAGTDILAISDISAAASRKITVAQLYTALTQTGLPLSIEEPRFGAVGDGVTDDTAALLLAHASGNDLIQVAPGTYLTTTGSINLRNKVTGCATGIYQCTASGAPVDFQLVGDRAILRDLKLVGEGLQTLSQGGSTDHTLIDNVWVENNKVAAPGQNGVRLANTTPFDYKLVNSVIDATGFAFTLDTASAGGSGLIVAQNFITSDDADAVELNMPNSAGTFTDAVVIGNLLRNLGSGTTAGRGFSVGIAGLQNVAVVGNAIMESRNEAFHIEDAVKQVVIVGNVARECYNDGIEFIGGNAEGASRALVVVGNSLEERAGVSGKYGIAFFTNTWPGSPAITSITRSGSVATVTTATAHGLYTGQNVSISGATEPEYNVSASSVIVLSATTFKYYVNGAPATPATGSPAYTVGNQSCPPSLMVGNAVRDFDNGLCPTSPICVADNNIVEEATTTVVEAGSSTIFGENLAVYQDGGVPASLVKFNQRAGICGKIYCNVEPTLRISKTAGLMPGMLRGFYHPITPYVHAGGTTDAVPIVTLPDLAKGRIVVRTFAKDSVSFVHCSADIHWDGTTLTVSSEIRKNVGSAGGALGGWTVAGGVLKLNHFYAAATTLYGNVDFTGEWITY